MSNRYVSLAIDHGTTNSCIAQMTPQGPRVIPPEADNKILPSAVYYDQRGGLQVGAAARRAIMTTTAVQGQGFTGYKLQIGGDMRYEFAAARKSMTAPELGAVIIQTLLRAHYRSSGVDPCQVQAECRRRHAGRRRNGRPEILSFNYGTSSGCHVLWLQRQRAARRMDGL